MPSPISLAQFNRIASGTYNAGQIDIATAKDGSQSLVKVNNHVWFTIRNNVQLSPERVLEVKEAFVKALNDEARLGRAELCAVRKELGLSVDTDAAVDAADVDALVKKRFTPLTRAQVRTILDKYTMNGQPFTLQGYEDSLAAGGDVARGTRAATPRMVARREAVNAKAPTSVDSTQAHDILDAVSILTDAKSLKDVNDTRCQRESGDTSATDSSGATAKLRNGFYSLFKAALNLLPAGVRESDEFIICGTPAKIIKSGDGSLSVVLGKGSTATTVKLGVDAQSFVDRLVDRTVKDVETLGPVAKLALNEVYDRDIGNHLVASDRRSLTRQFAAKILAGYASLDAAHAPAFSAADLMTGNYNTGLLVQIAVRALDGEEVDKFNTKAMLDRYHAALVRDNAGLPAEMKAMLEEVADIPLEKPSGSTGELIVHAPIVGDIQPLVAAIPVQPSGPVPAALGDIGGIAGIKNFMADLIFSDETMVADVVVNRPGEAMRNILLDDKKLVALIELIKNPDLIDSAVAPQIRGDVKRGFAQMIDVIKDAFQKANGESLADAAGKGNFNERFKNFLRSQIPGEELAKFDPIIESMASTGCRELQKFINEVFKVNVGAASETGAITTDPYQLMDGKEIASDLSDKTLNQIINSSSTSDVPGQVGFFKQIVSTYFLRLEPEYKRSALASALRYATTFEFGDKQGDELNSAEKKAINAFTGAVLKGASPLLQKMMQGLPKEMMGEFADALEDMKSNLAPIPRKIVQAYLMKMIQDSQTPAPDGQPKPRITAIEIERSLGAASVGEAFLCKFTYDEPTGKTKTQSCVVKIMRHDAEKRVEQEAKIFTEAAAKIPGMAKTWEGQLQQYRTEFDFTNEAANVTAGIGLYGVKNDKSRTHVLQAIAPRVASMTMSSLVPPQKNVMVADRALGNTVDKFFANTIRSIRDTASDVFAKEHGTDRVLWRDGAPDPATGEPVKVPALLPDVSTASIINFSRSFGSSYAKLYDASVTLQQAAKAWFYQALLGNGQFHGDAHAGNLMLKESGETITFIDFGNLYTLKTRQDDHVNEKTELLRVILGAAFRSTDFVLQGFERLMSPEGRRALSKSDVRDKARKILDAVLAKGSFSANIVYRLQAAVVELQKLGLELPPQINCFIQSLVRLSNTVTEINTIMNQCRIMMDTVDAARLPAAEDELDVAGRAFDIFAQAVNSPADAEKDTRILRAIETLRMRMFGKNGGKVPGNMFEKDGPYQQQVVARLAAAADVAAEAEKIYGIVSRHRCAKGRYKEVFEDFDDQMKAFRDSYAAASAQEEKNAAIQAFAQACAAAEGNVVRFFCSDVSSRSTVDDQGYEKAFHMLPPASFASALTEVITDNFDALVADFSFGEKLKFATVAQDLVQKELKPADDESVQEVLQRDSKVAGVDTGYKIDIGV